MARAQQLAAQRATNLFLINFQRLNLRNPLLEHFQRLNLRAQ